MITNLERHLLLKSVWTQASNSLGSLVVPPSAVMPHSSSDTIADVESDCAGSRNSDSPSIPQEHLMLALADKFHHSASVCAFNLSGL